MLLKLVMLTFAKLLHVIQGANIRQCQKCRQLYRSNYCTRSIINIVVIIHAACSAGLRNCVIVKITSKFFQLNFDSDLRK